jgi:hypothetical protein
LSLKVLKEIEQSGKVIVQPEPVLSIQLVLNPPPEKQAGGSRIMTRSSNVASSLGGVQKVVKFTDDSSQSGQCD